MKNSQQSFHRAGHYLILAITLLFGLLLGCSAVHHPSHDRSKGQQEAPVKLP